MATRYTNAHLLDPAQGIDQHGELLVDQGKVVAIGSQVECSADVETVDLGGLLLTPGWIDAHTHVFDTIGDFCLAADDVGIRSGVTAVADAGTSGVLTFNAFRRTVIDQSQTRVYALVDPSLLYIATSDFIAHRLEIAASPLNQDIDRVAEVVEANRDIVVGFKVRPVMKQGETKSPVMEAGRTLAEMFNLPIMVHLGRFPADAVMAPEDLLAALRPGDIVTHCFQPRYALFDLQGNLLPAAREALDRGILLDVGHSNADFSIATARAALAQGIVPHTLSTDLNCFNLEIVGSLALVMSRFLAFGLSLSEVVERVTSQAAMALRKTDEIGSLKPGMVADFTLAELVDEPTTLVDGRGGSMEVAQVLKVRGVCRAGAFQRLERLPFDVATPPEPALV